MQTYRFGLSHDDRLMLWLGMVAVILITAGVATMIWLMHTQTPDSLSDVRAYRRLIVSIGAIVLLGSFGMIFFVSMLLLRIDIDQQGVRLYSLLRVFPSRYIHWKHVIKAYEQDLEIKGQTFVKLCVQTADGKVLSLPHNGPYGHKSMVCAQAPFSFCDAVSRFAGIEVGCLTPNVQL